MTFEVQQLNKATLKEDTVVKNEKHDVNNASSITDNHTGTLEKNITSSDKNFLRKNVEYDNVSELTNFENQSDYFNYFININDTIIELEQHGHDDVENSNEYTELTTNVNNIHLNKTTVRNKEYQSLLDRFRRKNVTIGIDGNINVNTSSIDETKMEFGNSSMEKLIDDATRSKILHDYFKTVRKGIIEEDITFNETEFPDVRSEMEGDMGLYNGSLAYTDRPEASKVASFGKTRIPRPDFFDGK